MKRFASTLAISVLMTLAMPVAAIAQFAYAQPNRCEAIHRGPYYGESACLFHPTPEDGTLFVFPPSIQSRQGSSFAYFKYLPSWEGPMRNAKVNCNVRDHWHWWPTYADEREAQAEPAESWAAQRMLGYVCNEAGRYAVR